MDKAQLLNKLDLPPESPIEIVNLGMRMWGRELRFASRARSLAFTLHFIDCRETKWQLYTHMHHDDNPPFPVTDLVNIRLGRSQHRSPAHLLTAHFGLSLVYGEVRVIYADNVITLDT